MIADIAILTDRSETLVRKIYRKEALQHDVRGIFAKKLQDIKEGRIPPHFEEHGVHFYYIHRGSLYFVASSTGDVSTIAVTEFLSRLYSMAKDLCEVVTEESVRANFLPIFEMLSDAVDGGYVQMASTNTLKPFILSEPVSVVKAQSTPEEVACRIFGIDFRLTSAAAAYKPVSSSMDAGGLYVDVVESLTIVAGSQFSAGLLRGDGSIVVKNQLQGNPVIKVMVNEDLHIAKTSGETREYGVSAQIENCRFHPDVDLAQFDSKRILRITPTAIGEFTAMTYSVAGSTASTPILVNIIVRDIDDSRDKNVSIQVRPCFPPIAVATKVHVMLPVPAAVSSVSQHVTGPSESLTFQDKGKVVAWSIRGLEHSQESIAHLRLISHSSESIQKEDIGSATVDFEINQMTSSGLCVRNVKIFEGNQKYPAKRFVRHITASDSYTVKIS